MQGKGSLQNLKLDNNSLGKCLKIHIFWKSILIETVLVNNSFLTRTVPVIKSFLRGNVDSDPEKVLNCPQAENSESCNVLKIS